MAIKIKDLKIFESIELPAINILIDNSKRVEYKAGDIVMLEGDISDGNAYIIQEGEVSVTINKKEILDLKFGDIFGEIALVTDEPRTATISAKTDLVLLSINKKVLDMIIKNMKNGAEIKKTILDRIKQNLKK